MERAVIVGSSGFIGRNLVSRLKADGVKVFDRDRTYRPISVDRIYHLGCTSSNDFIYNRTRYTMDSIMDATRGAMSIDPTALFVNASSMGASEVDDTPQGAYNTAKRCMEIYLKYSSMRYANYRLPAVYGEGMHDDHFIKKCVDGKAHIPEHTHMPYYISHVDDVVDALVKLEPLKIERITLGEIYEQFTTGRRGLHRPTSNT